MSSSVKKTALNSAKLVVLFITTVFILVLLLSPFASHHYATKYLNDHQLMLNDDTVIRYNPFESSLTIRNLALFKKSNAKKPVLSVKALKVKVSLYKLLTDTLHFSEFSIDGLYLDVNLNEKIPVIAGFDIASHSIDSAASANEPEENPNKLEDIKASDKRNNYQVSLPNFSITNATFDISIEQSKQNFTINSLVIKNVLASTKAQQVDISLNALMNKAPLFLDVSAKLANNQGEITSELALSKLALMPLQPLLSAIKEEKNPLTLQGAVSINSKQLISITDLSTKINLDTFELLTENFKAKQGNKTVELNIAPFSIKNLVVELIDEQAPIVVGTIKLNVNKIMAYEGKTSQLLAQISAINLDKIAITTSDSLVSANIEKLIIEQSMFAENTEDDHQPLAKFQNITINDITFSQQGLLIDTISLLGLAIDAKLDEEKHVVGLPVQEKDTHPIDKPLDNKADKAEVEALEDNNKSPFALSINSFSFADTGYINFTDQSTSPHYKRDFTITTFNAGPFDNQKPQQESKFTLKGGSDKYATFDLSAVAKPFSKEDFYTLKGFFKEVSLPSLSTYISEALKYELKAGQLDVVLDVTVENTDIDGNFVLLLRGVELGASNDHEADTVKSQTSVPFNIALGMLKDSDGNVELDVPLDGSTDEPSFGMRGFVSLMVKQATMSAAKEYLMTTFVPYANVVTIAMSAGDYLLKVRVNDLVFPVKETELTDDHTAFLIQFAALMKDKPETQLTLCAIATPEDINKPLGVEITDKQAIKRLAELSEQRLDTFKEHMVKKEGIASSRLLFCSPKIDSSIGAQPRITFTD